MTLTAIARELGVSNMTIYRRCKKRGVNIEELRDSDTGEITAAGVAVIASLFDATAPQMAPTGDATQMQPGCNGDAQTASQGQAGPSEAVLQAQVDGLTAALQAEQADRQAERRLLTGGAGDPDGQPRRRGLFGWLRR